MAVSNLVTNRISTEKTTMKTTFSFISYSALLLLLTLNLQLSTFAQGSAFTYQGRLNSGTNPANGSYDVSFALFGASSGGSAIGLPVTNTAMAVSNGLFTTTVNLGNVFTGTSNWLELAVSTNGANAFFTLAPRQQLTPTPYAIFAESANATNLVGTVPSANLSGVALRAGGNVFTGQQTITGGSVGIGTITPAKQFDVTGTATGVGAGASIDPSIFVRINNTASDGNTSSPDFAGIGFGRNSTQQAIVGGTFGNDFLDFYTGGLLTGPKMRIDFSGNVGIVTNHVLEFAYGLAGKEANAGKIGYERFSADSLDIVGAGTAVSSRKVAFFAQGGATFDGNVSATGFTSSSAAATSSFAGKVGIGTTTPETALQVGSYGNPDTYLTVSTAGGNNYRAGIDLRHFNSGYGWTLLSDERDSSFRLLSHFADTNGITRLWVDRFSGNVGIGKTNPATLLDVAGDVTCTAINITSDRNAKEEFKPVNAREVLAKVAHMPITEWQYKQQADARHIGPMAQDFRNAFTLGQDEKHISVVDEGGVALAAIQGLNEKVDEKDIRIQEQAAKIQELSRTVSELKMMVEQLGQKMSRPGAK